jgi:thioredoxin-dependent peroxiredoxin
MGRSQRKDRLVKRALSLLGGPLAVLCFSTACSKPASEPSGSATATAAPGSVAAVPASAASEPEAKLLEVGAPAPAIESVAHNGQTVKLADLRGRPIVVYFYPKDDTKGCTIEAEEIRDDWADLTKANAVVLGVSTDDNASHRAFATKYGLPFLLLPDTDQSIAKAFGVPVVKGYVKRVTFIIDKQGKIAKVFPQVNPKGHSDEILAALQSG